MRGTKSFGIGTAFVVCVLAILLAMPVAWAVKPDWAGPQPETTEYYGYATLSDGYVITSDPGGVQYADREAPVPGQGMVEALIDVQTHELLRSRTVLGMIEKTKKKEYESPRRVDFGFDVHDDVSGTPEGAGMPVFDILDGKTPGPVHFAVCWWESSGAVDYVAFIIDDLTQTEVNNLGGTENYRTSALGHVIYYLDYWPVPDDPNGIGAPGGEYPEWTFKPELGSEDPVILYVMRTVGNGNSKGGAYQRVNLAKYVGEKRPLFKLTVQFPTAPLAPQRPKTFSTVWGEIKAR